MKKTTTLQGYTEFYEHQKTKTPHYGENIYLILYGVDSHIKFYFYR